jgi:hypothetical protein
VVERSTALFDAPVQTSNFGSPMSESFSASIRIGAAYDVTADSQRFLFNIPAGSLDPRPSITVVMNWAAEVEKR